MTASSTKFSLHVSYGQISIADRDCDPPFNNWEPRHVEQGFAWRPGCVVFGTLEASGPVEVEVVVGSTVPRGDAERVIVVPFTVGASGEAQFLDAFSYGPDVRRARVGPGTHALRFETGHLAGEAPGRMWVRIVFTPGENPEPQILIADAALKPPARLALDAEPI